MNQIIIQLICPDQKNIIARLTTILSNYGNNILSIEQHVDSKKFYIRVLSELSPKKNKFELLKNELLLLNKKLNGKISFFNPDKKINLAILGTKESEPIYDLLIKNKSENLNCNIPIILSNHNNLKNVAKQFKTDFLLIKKNQDITKTLAAYKIDLIVLARYMQIIPNNIIKSYENKIINIHHGFLPAFKGSSPYKQAFNRGVKIIGATAHYVTDRLDDGPIISQNIIPINHMHSISDMMQLGREVEKNVLFKAVKAHLDNKIIVFKNKTIIFR